MATMGTASPLPVLVTSGVNVLGSNVLGSPADCDLARRISGTHKPPGLYKGAPYKRLNYCVRVSLLFFTCQLPIMGNNAVGATHRFALVVLSCLIVTPLVVAVDVCDVLTLDICKRAAFDMPTGFAVKQCGRLKLPCGIKVQTKKVDICTQAQISWQDRAESICRCVPELLTRLQATPALIRQGVAEAADPVTGITSPLLSGVWLCLLLWSELSISLQGEPLAVHVLCL